MKKPARPPPLEICSQELHVIDCVKILGVQISSDLKWNNHISHLIHKANGKHYMLNILKKFNLSTVDLLTIFLQGLWAITFSMYSVPVWNAG